MIKDEVPPLEDMTEYLASRKAAAPITNPVRKPAPVSKSKDKQFTGLKKGFFDQPNAKPDSNTVAKKIVSKDDDIPFIKSNPTKNSLEFEEVKSAMATQLDQNRKEWMTPEFLDRIDKSPVLQKAFQSPQFLQLMSEMSKDPISTFKKCENKFPQYLEALKEFAGLLGSAFEQKAEEKERLELEENMAKLNPFEQDLVKKVMSNTELQNALKNPKMQHLLMQLQTNPPYLTECLRSADPDMKKHIKLLMEAGLLQLQK
ncbi:hypothetical protein HDV06_001008 [Boothiomyces sp. JEL0866]|nr:hypothetical protein HDV06_001008 [Boothiomyces sp. JEL0866]